MVDEADETVLTGIADDIYEAFLGAIVRMGLTPETSGMLLRGSLVGSFVLGIRAAQKFPEWTQAVIADGCAHGAPMPSDAALLMIVTQNPVSPEEPS